MICGLARRREGCRLASRERRGHVACHGAPPSSLWPRISHPPGLAALPYRCFSSYLPPTLPVRTSSYYSGSRLHSPSPARPHFHRQHFPSARAGPAGSGIRVCIGSWRAVEARPPAVPAPPCPAPEHTPEQGSVPRGPRRSLTPLPRPRRSLTPLPRPRRSLTPVPRPRRSLTPRPAPSAQSPGSVD